MLYKHIRNSVPKTNRGREDMAEKKIAFVAIRQDRTGISFAYLPNTDIKLPEGWRWCRYYCDEKDVADTREFDERVCDRWIEDTRQAFKHLGVTF